MIQTSPRACRCPDTAGTGSVHAPLAPGGAGCPVTDRRLPVLPPAPYGPARAAVSQAAAQAAGRP